MTFIELENLKAKDRRRAWACYAIGFAGSILTPSAYPIAVGFTAWLILKIDYRITYGRDLI
jgi:hypothetical protein